MKTNQFTLSSTDLVAYLNDEVGGMELLGKLLSSGGERVGDIVCIRAFRITELGFGIAASAVGIWIFRVRFDCLVKLGYRAVSLANTPTRLDGRSPATMPLRPELMQL